MNEKDSALPVDNMPFPKLQDFLCFAVYTANLAFGKAYKPYLSGLDLTYTQWIALLALAEEDNQTVNRLGQKLFLASNTLTPLLKGLEKQGLVTRRRSAQDERQVVVSLTAKGRKLRNASRDCFDIFNSYGLTTQEAQALQNAVVKLRDHLLAGLEK